jgi:sugar phosphate isomerase/epimerase
MPCYHTHSGHFYGLNASALMHLLDGMDPERIGAFLDAGHLMLDGEPFVMALAIVEPYLKLVAIKDPRYVKGGRKIVPLGEGLVDWVGVCRDLKAISFDGPVTLHSEYDLEVEPLIKTVRQDIQRFKAWMAEAGW